MPRTKTSKASPKDVHPVSVQVPTELLSVIDERAKRERRSRSAEMLVLIEAALGPAPAPRAAG